MSDESGGSIGGSLRMMQELRLVGERLRIAEEALRHIAEQGFDAYDRESAADALRVMGVVGQGGADLAELLRRIDTLTVEVVAGRQSQQELLECLLRASQMLDQEQRREARFSWPPQGS